MTSEEKRKLGTWLSKLSPEDLNKALEIIAQDNPNFQYTAEEVDLDMDAQVLSLPPCLPLPLHPLPPLKSYKLPLPYPWSNLSQYSPTKYDSKIATMIHCRILFQSF